MIITGCIHDSTLQFQPTVYTFQPGHKAALVITAWDPYNYMLDGTYSDEVSALLKSYSFDIGNETLEVRFPVAKGSSSK